MIRKKALGVDHVDVARTLSILGCAAGKARRSRGGRTVPSGCSRGSGENDGGCSSESCANASGATYVAEKGKSTCSLGISAAVIAVVSGCFVFQSRRCGNAYGRYAIAT